MLAFDIAGLRFQLRAVAVVVHGGHVLLHRLEGDDYWSLPGGRVEPGEEARHTVAREMHEELDERVECDELLHVVENFFEDRGRRGHEIGFYFRVRFAPGSRMLDTTRAHAGVEGDQRLEFRWFPLAQIETVHMHPVILRESLAHPGTVPLHVVQRG